MTTPTGPLRTVRVPPAPEGAISLADYPRRRRTQPGQRSARPRIVQLLASGTTGGAQQSAIDLILHLDRRAFEVTTIFLSAGPAVDRLRRLGMPTHVLDGSAPDEGVEELAGILDESEIDLVHAHMFAAERLAAATLAGRMGPILVATIHSSRVRSAADREALAAANPAFARLIVPSRAMADKVAAEGRGSVATTVIPNGVDLGRHRTRPGGWFRAEFGIPPDAYLMGVVGRLEPEKGHAFLLAALPAVLDLVAGAWLVVIGDGSQAADLQARAADLPPAVARRIAFTGARRDVSALTGDLDVAVLPSLREAQGLVLLEAMARGKPVVASKVGGIPEVVLPGRTGLLVPPADSAALAAALVRLAHDPDLAHRLGKAGLVRVARHFSLEAMVAAVERVYRQELQRAGVRLAATTPQAPALRVGRASGEIAPI